VASYGDGWDALFMKVCLVGLCSDLVLVLGWCCVSLCVFIVKVCCLWFMGAWVWCGLMLWKRLSCLFCGIAVCKLVVIAGVLL